MKPTSRMEPRPVWARRERRLAGVELRPPTDLEKHDAIRVLEQGITFPLSLYAEAEAIMRETTEGRPLSPLDHIAEVDDDFLDVPPLDTL